jgi:uncharacterized cupredoxin-like copper-binding protein
MKAKRLPLMILAMLALAFAGCGDDDDDDDGGGGSGGGGGGSAETVQLSATDFKFTPASPTVAEPGEVTFVVTNDGDTDHALEVEGPDEEQETDTIAPGDSAELTVDLSEEGSFEMYCPIGNHKEMGMEGEVVVGSGSGGGDSDDDSGGGGGGYGY